MNEYPDLTMTTASTAGALATVLRNRSDDSTLRKVGEGLCGALVGIFGGPAVADLAGVHNEHFRMAIAFLTGAAGYLLLTKILDLTKAADLRAVAGGLADKIGLPKSP